MSNPFKYITFLLNYIFVENSKNNTIFGQFHLFSISHFWFTLLTTKNNLIAYHRLQNTIIMSISFTTISVTHTLVQASMFTCVKFLAEGGWSEP